MIGKCSLQILATIIFFAGETPSAYLSVFVIEVNVQTCWISEGARGSESEQKRNLCLLPLIKDVRMFT